MLRDQVLTLNDVNWVAGSPQVWIPAPSYGIARNSAKTQAGRFGLGHHPGLRNLSVLYEVSLPDANVEVCISVQQTSGSATVECTC